MTLIESHGKAVIIEPAAAKFLSAIVLSGAEFLLLAVLTQSLA
jgi:hypothetical protein